MIFQLTKRVGENAFIFDGNYFEVYCCSKWKVGDFQRGNAIHAFVQEPEQFKLFFNT